MVEFIGYMTDVLAIELTTGTVTLSLGGIALGVIIIKRGVAFFKGLFGSR